jgi:hypothetical protein
VAELGSVRLDQHFAELVSMIAAGNAELDRGHLEAAAVAGQVASTFAWMNHAGVFASPDLERLLAQVALRAQPPTGRGVRRVPNDLDPRRILHVVTQVYGTGGHTQMIARWIEQDADRSHRVAITRQGVKEIPAKVTSALSAPGDVFALDRKPGGLLRRANDLRRAAQWADLVVLHIHPYDVVPVLAFAGRADGPPVVYVNHADHVFWIGTNVGSVLMNLRDSGRDLAVERRGIALERNAVVPRPLGLAERSVARAAAKAELGVSADQVLLTTAAAGSKYEPIDTPGFLDLVVPLLRANPQAVLYAAGPDPKGQWSAAADATGGRIRALGRLPDVTTLHQAADIYLDAYPFSSLTSMIEAGSYGAPVVTYRGHPADCDVLGADTPGLDEHLVRPGDPSEFVERVGALIRDAGMRADTGARTEQVIRHLHDRATWPGEITRLYRQAFEVGAIPPSRPVARSTGQLDQLVDLVQAQSGFSDGRRGALLDNIGLYPARARLATWRRLRQDGPVPRELLVPEWTLPGVAGLRRSVRKRWKS